MIGNNIINKSVFVSICFSHDVIASKILLRERRSKCFHVVDHTI